MSKKAHAHEETEGTTSSHRRSISVKSADADADIDYFQSLLDSSVRPGESINVSVTDAKDSADLRKRVKADLDDQLKRQRS